MPALILIRGGGDLASGVALRLQRAGLKVIISELAQPLTVRRTVSFAEAVFAGQITIEGVTARLSRKEQLQAVLDAEEIPVLIDPHVSNLSELPVQVVIDARLTKQPPAPLPVDVALHIGLGPGFHAGYNCHAVVETRRSHTLGRVYWDGPTQPDSGQPEGDPLRVLRAPLDGQLIGYAQIGEHLNQGDLIAKILPGLRSRHSTTPTQDETEGQDAVKIISPFKGVLRGIIHTGLHVTAGLKIGDVDPRDDPELCKLVSDKALAIGGGVLEALLTRAEFRGRLWK